MAPQNLEKKPPPLETHKIPRTEHSISFLSRGGPRPLGGTRFASSPAAPTPASFFSTGIKLALVSHRFALQTFPGPAQGLKGVCLTRGSSRNVQGRSIPRCVRGSVIKPRRPRSPSPSPAASRRGSPPSASPSRTPGPGPHPGCRAPRAEWEGPGRGKQVHLRRALGSACPPPADRVGGGSEARAPPVARRQVRDAPPRREASAAGEHQL